MRRENGVRSLAIYCHQCHHETVINVDHLPGDLTVPSFGPKMVCTKCGTIGADARPYWREGRSGVTLPALGGARRRRVIVRALEAVPANARQRRLALVIATVPPCNRGDNESYSYRLVRRRFSAIC